MPRSFSAGSSLGCTRPSSSATSSPTPGPTIEPSSWSWPGPGCERGELCGLRGARVDLGRRRLEVATVRYDAGRFGRGYKPRPKSTASIRSIPLAGLVVEELRRRRPAERSSLLFPDASRYRLRHAYLRALRQARAHGHLLGLELRGPHDLRHTFATWLEDDGIPARVIDELMSHAVVVGG